MFAQLQHLSSRRGVYSGYCALAAAAFFILLSNVMGVVNQMTYVEVPKEVAKGAGYDTFGTGDTSPVFVLRDDAGAFIHLSGGAALVITGLMLVCLLGTIIVGVLQGSTSRAVLPGLAFVLCSGVLGADYFARTDLGFVGANPSLSVLIAIGVGGLLAALLREWRPTLIPRAPDTLPAEQSAQDQMVSR